MQKKLPFTLSFNPLMMYPQKKYLTIPVCFYIMLVSSCSTAHSLPDFDKGRSPIIAYQNSASANNNPAFTGPPEDFLDTLSTNARTKPVIERGGKYVAIPPAYRMLKPEKGTEKYAAATLQYRIKKIKKFAAENNYDTTVAFFIDMQVKSNKDRFLVMNLAGNSITNKGIVAHGRGNEKFTFAKKFSNDEGSNCTSLGMYSIGKAYNGAFGLSYKLYGLNKTNNNALKRYVVLHSMGSIPYAEGKYPVTQTEGCPAVAPAFLEELAPILDNAKKRILLYIYYGDND